MECIYQRQKYGFTLVEISIAMIIIGLLIGGTFGGMQLVQNMQINRTVQDWQSIRSSALTFRDTFGRLPGDMTNPSARLASCTSPPCATGGDGNRVIGITNMYGQTINATSENFTFWHHLEAAGLTSLGIKNTSDMDYGEGQPEAPIGGGYLVLNVASILWGPPVGGCRRTLGPHGIIISSALDGNYTTGAASNSVQCSAVAAIDRKADDGKSMTGMIMGSTPCHTSSTCDSDYQLSGVGKIYSKGF